MSVTSLHILPVYSELYPKTIGNVQLFAHQIRTLEVFNNPDVDVVVNTAMTGDGKSLAAYLPVFEQGRYVLAMYPTNELILDQNAALASYGERLNLRIPAHEAMYSDKITRLVQMHDPSTRIEEIRKLLNRNSMVLTNPDLVHLMMSYHYGWGQQLKELPALLAANFEYLLFDEFHVFGVPQVLAVINMLGYLAALYEQRPEQRKKAIFLSATPTPLFTRLLARSGLRYETITGNYRSAPEPEYRCILQGCDLSLHEVSQETPTELWVEEHLQELLLFMQQHPDSKAAVLVYSVATARRLFARLRAFFAPYGISVGENTGLTNRAERAESLKKDILVGTSTVDVGIDFHINYLVFEAFNAGGFLQRFGRLGRHAEFTAYQAHALVPRFVRERLEKDLSDTVEVEREHLNTLVREAFPTEQEFELYTKLWGPTQAAHVLVALQDEGKKGQDANQAFAAALTAHYERLYNGTIEKPVMARAVKKYWYLKKKAPEILQELASFRGQSPLSCGVWDTDHHLKTYDLFFLLTNTDFEVLQQSEFMHEVRRLGLDEREFHGQLLYLKVHEYIPERLQLMLGLPLDLGQTPEALHKMQVCSSFTVREPAHRWLDQVNRAFKQLRLPCIFSDMQRQELKGRLHLSAMFPIYRLRDQAGDEYSVAFGQEALLLESILFYRKNKGDKPMML